VARRVFPSLPPWARRLAAGLGVAAAALGALEGGLRLRYSREDLLFRYERPGALVTVTDGVLFPQPSVELTNSDGPYIWKAKHNASGFRESAPTPAYPPKGKRRLLALGDSWVYGFSVTQGHTVSDRVEARMPEIDMVNAGVFGSSAFDMLRRYTELVDELHPDGIVLGLPHNHHRQEDMASQRASFYLHPSPRPRSDLRTYLWLRWLLAEARAPRYATPPADLSSEMGDLVSIARDAKKRGLPVYFLLVPARWPGTEVSTDWVTALAPEGVRFAGHALPERACWGFLDLGHPSEAGADAIASTLVAVLQGGPSQTAAARTPSCLTSDGAGPGKDGWPAE